MNIPSVLRQLSLAGCVSLLVWVPVAAQSTPKEGKLRTKVLDALKAVAAGSCSEDLMAPLLLDACEQHLDRMRARFDELGTIKDARFRGVEQMQNGVEAEVYRVIFTNGSMTWMAAVGSTGKLSVLWSPG